jgi:alcohol dehydrogenase class IV
MRFEFATANRILFGAGSVAELTAVVREFGDRVLLVTGADPRRAERASAALRSAGVSVASFAIRHEPTLEDVQSGAAAARDAAVNSVVGFGGGSVIDGAKAIAALATNPGELTDFLEVIGRAQPLRAAPLPYVAVPTTAGTGAEVTRNAVLSSTEHKVKVSLRSALMLPRAAIVDPELTYGLPPALTASTGLDALTQLIEPYVSCRANPMTDAFCAEGLRRVGRSLTKAFDNGGDAAAREDMALASLHGGIALANAGLGAVHGFAGPIGGAFPAPHGAVCAALLPHATAVNLRALRERAPAAVERYAEVARLLTGRPTASADDLVSWLRALVARLAIRPLGAYGLGTADVPGLVAAALKASSMKGNPIALTSDECAEILAAAL